MKKYIHFLLVFFLISCTSSKEIETDYFSSKILSSWEIKQDELFGDLHQFHLVKKGDVETISVSSHRQMVDLEAWLLKTQTYIENQIKDDFQHKAKVNFAEISSKKFKNHQTKSVDFSVEIEKKSYQGEIYCFYEDDKSFSVVFFAENIKKEKDFEIFEDNFKVK